VELALAPGRHEGLPSPYDREYQTQHGNPFADSRFDEVPVKASEDDDDDSRWDPVFPKEDDFEPGAKWEPLRGKESAVDLSTGMVDGHDRVLPPREDMKKVRSETTQKALDHEKAKDEKGYLTARRASYDLVRDGNKRIATKVASNSFFSQFVTANNVKVDDHSLIVNIPRGRVTLAQFSIKTAERMEQELSKTLRVRAKFAHLILASGFDGIALEFLLV
jgi:hypothetical protein